MGFQNFKQSLREAFTETIAVPLFCRRHDRALETNEDDAERHRRLYDGLYNTHGHPEVVARAGIEAERMAVRSVGSGGPSHALEILHHAHLYSNGSPYAVDAYVAVGVAFKKHHGPEMMQLLCRQLRSDMDVKTAHMSLHRIHHGCTARNPEVTALLAQQMYEAGRQRHFAHQQSTARDTMHGYRQIMGETDSIMPTNEPLDL